MYITLCISRIFLSPEIILKPKENKLCNVKNKIVPKKHSTVCVYNLLFSNCT